MNNPLLDRKFLKELDKQHLRFVYAKVISLNLDEEPVEEDIDDMLDEVATQE